jgi:hypothetical protein
LHGTLVCALLCGAIPLAVGSGIFILWCGTGWDWLQGAGLLTIWAGLFAVFGGALCLVAFIAESFGARRRLGWRDGAVCLLALALLAANVPACAAIIDAVVRLDRARWSIDRAEELYREGAVRVVNASGAPAEDVRIIGLPSGGELGAIPPGGGSVAFFDVPAGTELTVRASWQGRAVEATCRVQAPGQWGREFVVVLSPDGTLQAVPMWGRTAPGMD